MKESFDSKSHRETYKELQNNLAEVESQISGDVSQDELEALTEKKKNALAELVGAQEAAEEEAHVDNDELDANTAAINDAQVEIARLQADIEKHKERNSEITGPGMERDTVESINEKLKELGSLATIDTSFEGGIISLAITPELKDKIKKWRTVIPAYNRADDKSAGWITDDLGSMPREPLSDAPFDAYIFSYDADPETRASSDAIVADMDMVGMRPATFSELIALAIIQPDLNKRSQILVALGTTAEVHLFRGPSVAILSWRDDERMRRPARILSETLWDARWDELTRFVCVRK